MNTTAATPLTSRQEGDDVPSPPVDKREGRIRAMFGNIAPRYDLLNHLLSLNIDRLWRRFTTRTVPPEPGVPVLDCCTGTADLALEEGREVFAVPGEITSALSAGTNALLRLGATPLTCSRDVLESLGIDAEEREMPLHPLLELLPATADELVRASRLTTGEVMAALAELEVAGLAAEGEGVYRRLA